MRERVREKEIGREIVTKLDGIERERDREREMVGREREGREKGGEREREKWIKPRYGMCK